MRFDRAIWVVSNLKTAKVLAPRGHLSAKIRLAGRDPPKPNKPRDCAANDGAGGGLYEIRPHDNFHDGPLFPNLP